MQQQQNLSVSVYNVIEMPDAYLLAAEFNSRTAEYNFATEYQINNVGQQEMERVATTHIDFLLIPHNSVVEIIPAGIVCNTIKYAIICIFNLDAQPLLQSREYSFIVFDREITKADGNVLARFHTNSDEQYAGIGDVATILTRLDMRTMSKLPNKC